MSHPNSRGTNGFDRFGLDKALNRGVRGAGFDRPRPIQTETIPAILDGRDVLGLAQTGTGKTAAFALPILDRLLQERRRGPRALILAPTRELATQIADEIRVLSRNTKLKLVIIYGGVSAKNQINALRHGPEIVVGCPGRVLDLLQQKELRLDGIESLVLDEADHMFDMGFLPDIRKILKALPERRQNLLFSATMPREIRHLADRLLKDPHVVQLTDSKPAETIDHALFPVGERRKRALLELLLSSDDCESAIVFLRTKMRARRLAEQLVKAGHDAVALQGNMSQNKRDKAMEGFRSGRFNILVATDIAARGIDVSAVSHVINFDVPNTPLAYTHRIGRTGRAELSGVACTFITSADHEWVRDTERMIGSPIPRKFIEGFEANADEVTEKSRPARNNRRRKATGQGQGQGSPGNRRRRRRRRGAQAGGATPSGGGPRGSRRRRSGNPKRSRRAAS